MAMRQGKSNRLSSLAEAVHDVEAVKNFEERAKVLGRAPGTHTLGKEFETVVKK